MTKKKAVCAESQPFLDRLSSAVNQFRIIGPVYATSAGLIAAYGWGWLTVFPNVFGWALTGVTATAELLKPVIGPLIEDRLAEARGPKAFALLLIAVACVGFGGLSSTIAFGAASAPQAAYEAGQTAVATARGVDADARVRLAAFDCTADMPASRCRANREANEQSIARADRDVDAAALALTTAIRHAPARPSVGVPVIPWFIAAGLGLGIDFVLLVMPWAARSNRPIEAAAPVVAKVPAKTAPPIVVAVSKVNDGGWATRRARYGASGLKRRGLKVVKAA